MGERERRSFEDEPLVRRRIPPKVAFFGWSGSGKTYSAGMLAMGLRDVWGWAGGWTVVFANADGDSRGREFADLFRGFRYVEFKPPHSGDDFADLIEQYGREKTVVFIDGMSEEHTGEGGLLRTQKELTQGKPQRNALAWAEAGMVHDRLRDAIKNCPVPIIACWRAKDKLDWSKAGKGTSPEPMGEMPIGRADLIFEMTMSLFLPKATQENRGIVCTKPILRGEQRMTKIPEYLEWLFEDGKPVTRMHGERLGWWALGDDVPAHVARLREAIKAAKTLEDLMESAAVIEDAPRTKTLTPVEYRYLQPMLAHKRSGLSSANEGEA